MRKEVYVLSTRHEEVITTKREVALEALGRGTRVNRVELMNDRVWSAHWLRSCKKCGEVDEVALQKVNLIQSYTSSYGTRLVRVGAILKSKKNSQALRCTLGLIEGKDYVHVTT